MSQRLGVVIVGAGPAGLAAGARAAQRRLSHVVLDGSRLAQTIFRYQKGKRVMAEPVALPLQADLPVRFEMGTREAVLQAWEEDTRAAGTDLRSGAEYEVVAITGAAGAFTLTLKGGDTLNAEHVVLAIGLQGNLRKFGVVGDDLPHVGYQLDDPAEHADGRVVVVGAGDAAIENAVALAEHAEQVALVNRRDDFARAKAGNRKLIEAAIEAGDIDYYPNSAVDHFEASCVVLATPEGEARLEASFVLGRLGALPPRKFLETIGIRFDSTDPNAVPAVDGRYQSNVPGIYLVGALTGQPLIKSCLNQGFEVIEHIVGNPVVPADEPLFENKFRGMAGTVSEILERIQATIPLFEPLTPIQLREFLQDASLHRPASGDVVFERNDFTDSIWFVVDGCVDVELPLADVDRDLAAQAGRSAVATLEKGRVFGEMSLISGRRRSATVRAGASCVLLEIPRLAMTRLINTSDDIRQTLDTLFLERKLETLAPSSRAEDRRELAALAEASVHPPGATLWNEGDDFDGLYLIRRGSVTVFLTRPEGEVVLNYVHAGEFLGEEAAIRESRKRGAGIRANVRTEVIRLPVDPVMAFFEKNRETRATLRGTLVSRIPERASSSSRRREAGLIGFLTEEGMGEATDLLLIDESLCVDCDNCETACAATHQGVSRLDREAGPLFAAIKVPTCCRHCENPKCMSDCPPDAIHRMATGEVFIRDNCIGCANCANNCPYGVIQMAELEPQPKRSVLLDLLFGPKAPATKEPSSGSCEKVAVKCDLCHGLPIAKTGSTACVSACPTGAVIRVDPARAVKELTATT